MNVLSQKYKLGGWTPEENELLKRLSAEIDKSANPSTETKAWREIGRKLQRTAKQCKRHLASLIRKKEKRVIMQEKQAVVKKLKAAESERSSAKKKPSKPKVNKQVKKEFDTIGVVAQVQPAEACEQ